MKVSARAGAIMSVQAMSAGCEVRAVAVNLTSLGF